MQRFDVCNGDADGLCAALQWRLHEPAPATLVTGLKLEIALLERVPAHRGDEVNVFDLSMQRNRAALLHLLDAGVRIRYFDHHAVRDIPSHPALEVDGRLRSFRSWNQSGVRPLRISSSRLRFARRSRSGRR